MRKKILAMAMLIVAFGVTRAAEEPIKGRWGADVERDGDVSLSLRTGGWNERHSAHFDLDIADLKGTTTKDLARWGRAVSFRLERDSGALVFEGHGGALWRPSGDFHFEPNPEFADKILELGFSPPTERELIRLAIYDLALTEIEQIVAAGFAPGNLRDVVEVAAYGIKGDYLAALTKTGLKMKLRDVIRFHNYDVAPSYIAAMDTLSEGQFDPSQIIRLHQYDVSSDYAQKVTTLIPNVGVDHILRLHTNSVSTDWLRTVAVAAEGAFNTDDFVRLHNYDLSAEYIRDAMRAGMASNSVNDLVRVYQHDLTTEYIAGMVALGHRPVDDLVRLENNSVSVAFVKALSELGYQDFDVDDLVRLRHQSVSPEFVKKLIDAGFTEMTADELIEARNRGLDEWRNSRSAA